MRLPESSKSGSSELEQVTAEISFVCPACKGELDYSNDVYSCGPCKKQYPVLFGIADFRLRSDRYLTLEQERDKARRLNEFAQTTSFEELVAYYYEITDDVPPELAKVYQAYVHNAPNQARGTVARLDPDADNDVLLDLGCGAGGFLVAASGRFKQLVGADIALRWLVICKKRLDELGVNATLVCADAEQLPFKGGEYSHVVAADLIEHVYDDKATIEQCYEQLKPGGRFWLSATNRYCMGPHPLTRIWGIGFLPRAARSAILMKLRGVDSLRYTNLVSPGTIKRLCRQAGFHLLDAGPRQLNIEDISAYPLQDRILIRCYQFMLRFVLFRGFLLSVGPAFEIICEKIVRKN
jgi:2-polyprenyl-3-methyl-5-hydroxy-6-metoxy-1,4-benzoquinol methylase